MTIADSPCVTQFGLDYAWGYTPSLVSALLASQVQFVCRYLPDPGGKGIDAAEARELIAAGIIICPNWETTGTTYAGGESAGISDGRQAAAALQALGAPDGTYVWFSIDADETDTALTNSYLRGCKAGTGAYIAQLYGSYTVVEAAAAAGLGDKHWQTYAWSGGKISVNAAIYQYENNVTIGGVSCDRDRTLQDITGPWAHFAAAPAPAPVPTPAPAPTPTPAEDEMTMAVAYWPADDSALAKPYYACVGADARLYYMGPEDRGWVCVDQGSRVKSGCSLAISSSGEKRIAYVNSSGVPCVYVAAPGSDTWSWSSLGGVPG